MMSSVSSHDGSDKDSVRHKTPTDGSLPPRYAALRKTDLLDVMDSLGRPRAGDMDSWSEAATIGDQESVVSAQGNNNANGGGGGLVGVSSTTMDAVPNDDMASLDNKVSSGGDSTTLVGGISNASSDMTLDNNSNHLLGTSLPMESDDDDYDRRSRSNAAEFGDDGRTRSTGSDFNMDSDSSDDRNGGELQQQQQHNTQNVNVVNDSIAAPPQPQPSFAPVTKSYVELLEENDMLQTQIHNLRTTQKHQAQVIEHLQSLTECSENAMQLNDKQQGAQIQAPPPLTQHLSSPQQDVSMMDQDSNKQQQRDDEDHTTTMTSLLERLYERLHHFVATTVGLAWQPSLEQDLFSLITDAYLVALPFGTNHQQLLNTAYRDQLRRFKSTLGASFATWYRRQTVQSLELNPATKDHLDHMQQQLTLQLMALLTKQLGTPMMDQGVWMEILHWCHVLALKLHGGDADVMVHPIPPGTDFDPHRMTAMVPSATSYIPIQTGVATVPTKKVRYVLSPLFIDEHDQVLLNARVILDDD